MHHENIQVLTRSVIVDHSGMPGLFKTGLQVGPQMFYRQITHGVTILATGAIPNRPQEYLLDEHDAVVTQLDLDRLLEDDPEKVKAWEKVVMIQCVGSRCPGEPQLLPRLLSVGRQERLEAARSEPPNPDLCPLPGHADLRVSGGRLSKRPGAGGPFLPL